MVSQILNTFHTHVPFDVSVSFSSYVADPPDRKPICVIPPPLPSHPPLPSCPAISFSTLVVSFPPSSRHSYPHHVIPTLITSFLPSSRHSYPHHVIPTLVMSFLPSSCHSYPRHVIPTLVMSSLPSSRHPHPHHVIPAKAGIRHSSLSSSGSYRACQSITFSILSSGP